MSGVAERNVLDEFCIRFCKIVEKHCKYIIVSGFVAISSGRTRATEDIDVIIERIPFEKFSDMHNALTKEGFISVQSDEPKELYSYLTDKIAVRYTLKGQPLPEMEMKFAKDTLDDIQLKTRIKLPLTGLDLWFSSINMNIAFKEELLKSDKDIKDAEHLRKVYPDLVDEEEIKEIKKMIRGLR